MKLFHLIPLLSPQHFQYLRSLPRSQDKQRLTVLSRSWTGRGGVGNAASSSYNLRVSFQGYCNPVSALSQLWLCTRCLLGFPLPGTQARSRLVYRFLPRCSLASSNNPDASVTPPFGVPPQERGSANAWISQLSPFLSFKTSVGTRKAMISLPFLFGKDFLYGLPARGAFASSSSL